MSIILHHTDMDGFCSARIARDTLLDPFDQGCVFIPYNYKGGLNKIEFKNNKKLIIVDLCCNKEIEEFIRRALTSGLSVIHIDHHASGVEYYNQHMTDLDDNENYAKWFCTNESASMLTWVYSFMGEYARKHVDAIAVEYAEDYSSFMMDGSGNMYGIPGGIKYINDNDVFRHQFPESKKFVKGLYSLKRDEIKPWAGIWNNILSSTDRIAEAKLISGYIEKGIEAIADEEKEFARERMNAFEVEIFGLKIMALNTTKRSSDLFGNMFNTADAVICFNYFKNRTWTYTFYSNNKVNVIELMHKIEENWPESIYNIGGHPYAGGCSSKKCIFDLID